MKARGKRHDGGVSRVCRFCGEVGARVVDIGGYVHRRCIGPQFREPGAFTPVQIATYWEKVDRSGGPDACWPWLRATVRSNSGKLYGAVQHPVTRRKVQAQRVALEIEKGPFDPNLFACHSCDNTLCCNPKHLWAGTAQQNSDDMVTKGRNAHLKDQIVFGEHNAFHKLTTAEVLAIVSDPRTDAAIAAAYNVAKATINHIKTGRNWSKVTGIRRHASVPA